MFSYTANIPDTTLVKGTYLIAIMNNPATTAEWMWAVTGLSAGHSYMMLNQGTPWREFSGGGVAEFAFSISAADVSPPRILGVEATPNVLWPPNNRMVSISVSVDTIDDFDPSPIVHIVGVWCNEPSGRFEPDWEVTGPLSLNLRAERFGRNRGRVYTIMVECEDSSGNTAHASVDVIVPHDRR